MGALQGNRGNMRSMCGEQRLELARARWIAETDSPGEPVSIPRSLRSIRMDGLRVSGRAFLLGSFLSSLSTD